VKALPTKQTKELLNMQPDEELEGHSDVEEGTAPPSFQITGFPTEQELTVLALEALIPELTALDLDDVRACLGVGQKRHVTLTTGSGRPGGPSRERGLAIEVGITFDLDDVEDGELRFCVMFQGSVSMIVVVKPEHFDRSVQAQEELYQKCLGLIEVQSQAVDHREYKSCGTFRFADYRNPEDGAAMHRELLERWKRT
jgi:hypothetical protein